MLRNFQVITNVGVDRINSFLTTSKVLARNESSSFRPNSSDAIVRGYGSCNGT